MNVHELVIARLTAHGFYAKRRDWDPGATVIVSRGTRNRGGIEALDGMIVLVWRGTSWDLQAPLSIPASVIEHGYATEEVCDRAIQYLQAPGDQVLRAFRAALRSADRPGLEYWHPERLPFRDGPYVAEASLAEASEAAQIHAVAQEAYALEASLIGCAGFPPLNESLEDLSRSGDTFLGFRKEGRIVGSLSFDGRTDSVVITRLVVSPNHLRQGIATALLTELMSRLLHVDSVSVSTAQANAPALSLYRRFGFRTKSVSDSTEWISLVHLTKPARHFKKEGATHLP